MGGQKSYIRKSYIRKFPDPFWTLKRELKSLKKKGVVCLLFQLFSRDFPNDILSDTGEKYRYDFGTKNWAIKFANVRFANAAFSIF